MKTRITLVFRTRSRRGVSRLAVIIAAVVVLAMVIGGVLTYRQTKRTFTVVTMHGGPVVVPSDVNAQVIALTSHWESRKFTSSNTGSVAITTTLHWDLWSFDARDLSRKWLTRLASIRDGAVPIDAGIFGVSNGTVWLLGGQLLAVSATDGHVIGDAAAIEEKNAGLRGTMPMSGKQFVFDQGLVIIAADGRRWRINDTSLAATPVEVGATNPAPNSGLFKPLRQSTQFETYKARGYVIDDRWYGLIHPSEFPALNEEFIEQDFRQSLRYTFWSAPMRDTVSRFGQKFRAPKNFQQIPGSPEFLLGGLLASRDSSYVQHVIGIANPTRFIIAHQDRLDESATQTLTCINLDGRVCWDAPLGVSQVSAVEMFAKGTPDNWSLLLIGKEHIVLQEGDRTRAVSPDRDMDVVFVRVGPVDGSVKRMSFGEVDLAKVSDETKAFRVTK